MRGEAEALTDPLDVAERWLGEGRKVALATVVETWGSAPRPAGSHLVVDGEGNFEGSVSGGCVEGAVVTEAGEVLAEGRPRTVDYGVADATAWQVGLSCGGRIRIFIEDAAAEANRDLLRDLNAIRRARQAAVVARDMVAGTGELHREGGDPGVLPLAAEVADRLRTGRSGPAESAGDGTLLLTAYLPPPRLVIVGATHISQALAPMARRADFDVTIVDPRPGFADAARFGGERVVAAWPDVAFADAPLDARTALAAVTHDPKIDDGALAAALSAGCFYVGALGSRKTHAQRRERLTAAGVGAGDLERIRAPIGLDIGARSPAEIAVAVLAEVVAALRRPEALS